LAIRHAHRRGDLVGVALLGVRMTEDTADGDERFAEHSAEDNLRLVRIAHERARLLKIEQKKMQSAFREAPAFVWVPFAYTPSNRR
jgi:hypothetical protein